MTVTPTISDIFTVLRSFILSFAPAGVDVIQGQVNRVPEPMAGSFVVTTPIRFERLETSVDEFADSSFTGSVAGTTLTVTAVAYGEISVGQTLYDLATGALAKITALGTGTGGAGTYTISTALTLASGALWSSSWSVTMPTQLTVQMDFHGPDTSIELANSFVALFRDLYGAQFFSDAIDGVAPLYADDARQVPFINAESQYEFRWVVDAVLQANESLIVDQQFADQLIATVASVQSQFPA